MKFSTHNPLGKLLSKVNTHQNSLGTKTNLNFTRASAGGGGALKKTVDAQGKRNFIVGRSLVDGDDVVV